MLSQYSYCSKSTGVQALLIVAVVSCAAVSILIGYHRAQIVLQSIAGLCGLTAMSLWLSLQSAINNDTTSSNALKLDLCESIVIFSWLVNFSGALLSFWGARVAPIIPSHILVSSSHV